MAEPNRFLGTFIERAVGYDDAALVALANKGLLRRAKKDLGAEVPKVISESERGLTLAVTEETLELRLPLQESSCTCPADGTCRHLLTALLWLREQTLSTSTDAETPDADDEMVQLDLETLREWGGLPLLRKAVAEIQRGVTVKPAQDNAGVLAIPDLNQTVHWLTGEGLTGTLCSCHAAGPCLHRMVAMIGRLVELGNVSLEEYTVIAPKRKESEAPRSVKEILAATQELLEGTLSLGLSRLTVATVSRFQTLAISAHGVDLPRLERALQTLAEELRLYAQRHAQADLTKLLGAYADAAALTAALHRPVPGLVGEHRSRYVDVGQLRLTGLGAHAWETRSGYRGLTLYFWNANADQWLSWTDARARTQDPHFDPLQRFQGEAPWSAALNPKRLAQSIIDVSNAWLNSVGRLSGRSATRAIERSPSTPDQLPPPIADWTKVRERGRRLLNHGLISPSPQEHLILLKPHIWEPATFDPVRQEVCRNVIDASDEQRLTLALPYGVPDHERAAAQALESLVPTSDTLVFGKLHVTQQRWWVEPITIWSGGTTSHLTLVPYTPSSQPLLRNAQSSPPFQNEDHCALLIERLEQVYQQLLALAESGFSSARRPLQWKDHITSLDGVGLKTMVDTLHALSDALEQHRRSPDPNSRMPARRLLATTYLYELTMAQLAATGFG